MKISWSLITICFAVLGCTGQATFDERVAQAKTYEESDAFKVYFENYWRTIEGHIYSALEQCFPLDRTPYARATLVADLLPNRTLSDIQVKPEDQMTQCFATAFAASPFPAPPPSLGTKGLPIRAEIVFHGPPPAP